MPSTACAKSDWKALFSAFTPIPGIVFKSLAFFIAHCSCLPEIQMLLFLYFSIIILLAMILLSWAQRGTYDIIYIQRFNDYCIINGLSHHDSHRDAVEGRDTAGIVYLGESRADFFGHVFIPQDDGLRSSRVDVGILCGRLSSCHRYARRIAYPICDVRGPLYQEPSSCFVRRLVVCLV